MAIWRRLESWLFWFPWYRRQARDADLARELRDHLDLEADEHRAAGLSPEEAAYAAHRALGNTLMIEEDVRAARGRRRRMARSCTTAAATSMMIRRWERRRRSSRSPHLRHFGDRATCFPFYSRTTRQEDGLSSWGSRPRSQVASTFPETTSGGWEPCPRQAASLRAMTTEPGHQLS